MKGTINQMAGLALVAASSILTVAEPRKLLTTGGRGSSKTPPKEEGHTGDREKARRLKQMAKKKLNTQRHGKGDIVSSFNAG